MGKGFKKAIKGIGKVVGKGLSIAAPFAGLIPGVGVPLGMALGAGGKALGRALSGKNTFGNGGLGEIAGGAAMGGGGAALAGGQGFKGLGNIGANISKIGKSGIGKAVAKQFTAPGGGVDLGRVVGAGTAVSSVLGARQSRKSAESYNNANTDLRNQLMSRILSSSSSTGAPR